MVPILIRTSGSKMRKSGVRKAQLTYLLILEISVYILSTSVQNVSGRPHNTSNTYSQHHPPDDPFIVSYRNNNFNSNNNIYSNTTMNKNNTINSNSNYNQNEDDHSDLMEELKEKILQDLGFEEIPNKQGLVAISKEEYLRAYTEYMFNVRRRRESQRGEPNNAKHRRKHAEIFLESIEPLKQELQQDISNNETARIIVTFQLKRPHRVDIEEQRVQVRQATILIPQDCRLVRSDPTVNEVVYEDAMMGFDVTKNVSRWLARQNNNTHDETTGLSFPLDCWGLSSKATRLDVVWMKLEKKRRVRRNAGRRWQLKVSDFADGKSEIKEKKLGKRRAKDCGEIKHGKKSCCRKSLEVSFADLEIKDFILAPTKFDMDYCEGRCSARRLPYASNHAIFQHIMLKNGRGAKLCCSPTKLSEVDVVQRDPLRLEQLKVTVIHNAKVEECGCS